MEQGKRPFYQYDSPTSTNPPKEFTDEALARRVKQDEEKREKEQRAKIQPPTAANPAPPELIPDESDALAVCLSPDVCRSPQTPIPYMVWGKADDKLNYSPDVRANGKVIKRHDSRFSRSYGDEPGVGKGLKSGTVGDVVTPVTSSAIVRANGIPVQRHTDRCTLNNGNCPGEYVHVKSTATHPAPDAKDQQDKAWYQEAWDATKEQGGHFLKGVTSTSDTAAIGQGSSESLATTSAIPRRSCATGNRSITVCRRIADLARDEKHCIRCATVRSSCVE